MADRVAFAAAGAAQRATTERALELGAPVGVLRVLMVVFSVTTAWSRLSAPISHKLIADHTGMKQREISRAFAWATAHELFDYQPGYSIPGGSRSASVVTLTLGVEDHGSLTPPMASNGHDPGRGVVATPGRGRPPIENPSRSNRGAGSPPGPTLAQKRAELARSLELVADERDREGLRRDLDEIERLLADERIGATG